jgi:hypothetical protein
MTGTGGLTASASSNTTLVLSRSISTPVKPSRWDGINVFKKSEKSFSSSAGNKRKSRKKTPDIKIADFNIQEVQDAAAAAEQEALVDPGKVSFWRRNRWAKRDKDELKAAVGQLSQGNNNLESILRLLSNERSFSAFAKQRSCRFAMATSHPYQQDSRGPPPEPHGPQREEG